MRQRVLAFDKEQIELLAQGKAGEVIASLAWQQNPTRWSCAGPLAALVRIVAPATGRVYGYTGAMDQQGLTMVSSTAMAFG
jgi:MEMO1 family protein